VTTQAIRQNMLFPTKLNPHPPIPSSGDLLRQVVVDPAAIGNFLYGGYMVSEGLRRALDLIGRPLDTFERVLDFGCGSARVLRWFRDLSQTCRFSGTDINAEAIEWCTRHISFAEFSTNGPRPPLPFDNDTFDLIYGISVVTHLDEELQLAWMSELQRLVRPGGILILTIHGDEITTWNLSAAEKARYAQTGHLYKRVAEHGGMDGLPDFYQVAYHTREYIETVWSRYFRLHAYIKNGPMYLQNMVMMEKAGPDTFPWHSTRNPSYTYLDLPIGCFDAPQVADVVAGPTLDVGGWCFHTDGGNVGIDLWIDGDRVGACTANHPRPDVGQVFSLHPSAARSGFSTTVSIEKLEEGPHRLWASPRTSLLPSFATYFFK